MDDLTLINGVGPATASTLNDAGYETIEDVATADLEDLEEIVGAKADAFIASANELIAAEAPEEPTPEPEPEPAPEPPAAPEPEAAESSFVGVWSSQVNLASSFELTILDADEDGSHAASLHYVIPHASGPSQSLTLSGVATLGLLGPANELRIRGTTERGHRFELVGLVDGQSVQGWASATLPGFAWRNRPHELLVWTAQWLSDLPEEE